MLQAYDIERLVDVRQYPRLAAIPAFLLGFAGYVAGRGEYQYAQRMDGGSTPDTAGIRQCLLAKRQLPIVCRLYGRASFAAALARSVVAARTRTTAICRRGGALAVSSVADLRRARGLGGRGGPYHRRETEPAARAQPWRGSTRLGF